MRAVRSVVLRVAPLPEADAEDYDAKDEPGDGHALRHETRVRGGYERGLWRERPPFQTQVQGSASW